MTGTLLFLGLGMQDCSFILWWEEDTRTDEGVGQRG